LARALDELTPAASKRIKVARAKVRRHVWNLPPALPASQVVDSDLGNVVILEVDATLVTAHSEKDSRHRRSRLVCVPPADGLVP
jgi:hypothetical protein